MTRTQRRRLQRELAEQRKAAGMFVPRARKSHYTTPDISHAVQSDLAAMRLIMNGGNLAPHLLSKEDRLAQQRQIAAGASWAFDPTAAKHIEPVTQLTAKA